MFMRKSIILLTAVFLIATATSYAAEKNTLSFWIKNTGSKLESVSKKKKDSAVAGVKGAPEKAPDELYWKGAKPDVNEEEVAALESAVERANKGESAAAIKELEAFIAKYPKSPLLADAQEGLKMLKAEKR
ncbi:MAG: hypothetical protein A3J24_01065 [Deltaproteobacteria bacterium RIFCSPLOWO2_02_FULL_53_8]|nr:MAG: hypothetical protein A3J24_01065 [Deltaproteobacteria bacterium RIFCSPLOWO2_02_FULL_53_8]